MINKKQYVGQTKRPDINDRWRQHKHKKAGRYLVGAYDKYGVENFKYQIICICFDEDCDRYEEEYIKKFNTMSPNGYNLKGGGHFSKLHPDSVEKMKESLKKVWTDEKRKEMSERFKGENGPNYGNKTSDETKEKLSEKSKKYWENMSKEEYERICKERKERFTGQTPSQKAIDALAKGREMNESCNKKPVGKYDTNNILLETFNSITDASTKTGICHGTISKVCLKKGYYKTAGGFVWKYV
jgi:group I intron endonuclease